MKFNLILVLAWKHKDATFQNTHYEFCLIREHCVTMQTIVRSKAQTALTILLDTGHWFYRTAIIKALLIKKFDRLKAKQK